MGCCQSREQWPPDLPGDGVYELTGSEVISIQRLWEWMGSDKDRKKLEDSVFNSMFLKYPESKKLFEDSQEGQGCNMMYTIDKIVNCLDDKEEVKNWMYRVREKHTESNKQIDLKYYESFMKKIEIDVRKKINKAIYTKETQMAFKTFLYYLVTLVLDESPIPEELLGMGPLERSMSITMANRQSISQASRSTSESIDSKQDKISVQKLSI